MSREAAHISVVIPAYNAEATIRRAISSVKRQTVPVAEIVVVDDGSTDGTAKIAREALSADRDKVVTQENYGVSVARNVGTRISQGDYVAFLDADDIWLPKHIATLSRLMVKEPSARFWASSAGRGTAHGRLSARGAARCTAGALRLRSCSSYFQLRTGLRRALWSPHVSTMAARRDVILAVGGFPEGVRIGEDLVLQMRLADEGRVVCTSRVTVLRVLEDSGVTNADLTRRNALPPEERIRAKFENGADMTEARARLCSVNNKSATRIRRYEENAIVRQVPRILLRGDEVAALRFIASEFVPPHSLQIHFVRSALGVIHQMRSLLKLHRLGPS